MNGWKKAARASKSAHKRSARKKSPKYSLSKGKRGERLFCEWLVATLKIPASEERFLLQKEHRFGGHDVEFEPFRFEVKNRERDDYQSYWNQIVRATRGTELEPVVAIYKGRSDWEFLITATLIGNEIGWMLVNEFTFTSYLRRRMTEFMQDSDYPMGD